VPGDYSFWDLHVAIQDAMGWLDYHLHAFVPTEQGNGDGNWEVGIPVEDEFLSDREIFVSWQVPVVNHFSEVGDRMVYVYDFGDEWTHDIVLKEITPSDSERPVTCTGGERACSPEDCGGTWGYQNLLEALADPGHDQHEDMKRWIGDSFDAEGFDPATVKFDDRRRRRPQGDERSEESISPGAPFSSKSSIT